MRRCNVTITDEYNRTKVLEKLILLTDSNSYYEIGRVLKEAIYGQVNHSFVLFLGDDGMYYRKNPPIQVAIKVYGKARLRAMAQTTQERPLDELSTMQFIGQHPHVMSPVECCADTDYIYLIMEFCNGGELYDVVEELQSLTENVARQYFRHILLGLEHLHNIGIAHRDMVSL
jgi:serine/threonine protein kinase